MELAIKKTINHQVQITERDLKIALCVWILGYVSTRQLWRIFFPGSRKQAATRRIKILTDEAVLEAVQDTQSLEYAYRIGPQGHYLIARETGISVEQAKKILQLRQSETPKLAVHHQVLASEIRLNFEEALSHRPDIQFRWISWSDYEVNGDKVQKVLVKRAFDSKRKISLWVIPDSALVIENFERSGLAFMEVDTGSEAIISRVSKKMIGYHYLAESGAYKHYYEQAKGFRVLFLTTSEKRIKNIRHTLAHTEGANLFLFGRIKDITPENLLNKEIFEDIAGNKKGIL